METVSAEANSGDEAGVAEGVVIFTHLRDAPDAACGGGGDGAAEEAVEREAVATTTGEEALVGGEVDERD